MIEAFRSEFARTDLVHLNNAGVAPMTLSAAAAIERAVYVHHQRGFHGVAEVIRTYEDARAVFARFIGVPPDNVAMMQTCAAAISQVALGFPFQAGDEIVRVDQEYPSNAYPWHEAARRTGAVVRVVPSLPDYRIDEGALLQAIGPKTKMVAVSWVQFQTGSMVDLGKLRERCDRYGAWLAVDSIQGLGAIPFSFAKYPVDALFGGTHKWLCGPLGHGFLALAPHRLDVLTPLLHGAMTYGVPEDPVDPNRKPRTKAPRFEPGSPLLLGAIGGAASMEAFERAGVENIHREALRISEGLVAGILSHGGKVLSDTKSPGRSPMVTFIPQDTEATVASFTHERISFARRAGGIRLAPHAFNTEDDVSRVLSALK